ncbi:MAG: hypothetical protein ACR2PB_03975 [Desulfocapsaceae bacterium]
MSTIPANRFKTIRGYRIAALSSSDLKMLWAAVEKFRVEGIRFTPGSQIAVSGLADEQFHAFISYLKPLLKPQPKDGIISIFNCNDCGECKNGCIKTGELVAKLDSLELPQPLPARIKVAVAGCPRCCTMPKLRDIGFIAASAKAQTWNIYFGGNGGRTPRIADQIGANLSVEEGLDLIQRALTVYQREAGDKMRTSAYLRNTPLKLFLKKLEKNTSIDSGQGN